MFMYYYCLLLLLTKPTGVENLTLMDTLTQTIKSARRVILTVGSGDGSQQASIFRSGHRNIVVTFFDSEATVKSKYPRNDIDFLRSQSVTTLFGVDATKLHDHSVLEEMSFDLILFTFPHTGVANYALGVKGPNPAGIESNRRLIGDFLKSAQHILTDNGEIVVTLKTSAPYDKWDFPNFATYDIEPKSNHNFKDELFPGYVHVSTERHSNGIRVKNGAAKTFVFSGKKVDDKEDAGETPNNDLATFKLSIEFIPMNDEDVENFVSETLKEVVYFNRKNLNVLDIRRRFPEAIRPDTRQLNRVLYDMESSGRLKKGPPKKSNRKPTWCLVHLKGKSASPLHSSTPEKTHQM